MVIIKVSISYVCDKCGMGYNLRFTPVPQEPIEILQSVDRIKRCTACAGFMRIARAIFTTSEGRYGDDYNGSWQCPVHAAFTYYPSLMRKAARNRLLIADAGYDNFERYKKLANDGYPWKCPQCGKFMKYIDDRTKYIEGLEENS